MTDTLRLVNLTTGYRSRHTSTVISRDLNASLPTGRFTCLLGPNGAGKSTLLRTICGFQKPLSGCAEIGGRDIAQMKPHEIARTIGVVLTARPLSGDMTVCDLVAMGRSPYTGFFGKISAADREIIDRALAMTGIDSMKDRRVHTLSDGERQKAMIAKALAQQTPIICLDEPTAFLDYPSKRDMMQMLRDIAHAEGTTVFMSTHDVEMALQIADNLWLLNRAGLTVAPHATLPEILPLFD